MSDRTKIWIAETMKELMKQKPIDRIRVTEICRAAGIQRPTFYYHFKDKQDLIAWIFFQNAVDIDIVDIEAAAEAMRKMKKELSVFYQRAYADVSQNALTHYILEYFTERYTQITMAKLHTDRLDTDLAFCIRMYCYGTVGMTMEWALYDNITPAETEVEMMFHAMPAPLRAVLLTEDDRSQTA
ncbi:MAG: TetR family transcriptional regulator [Solobacterium sp.]|nr:TetR family transcriptional regulator [Solobacterium sp.]